MAKDITQALHGVPPFVGNDDGRGEIADAVELGGEQVGIVIDVMRQLAIKCIVKACQAAAGANALGIALNTGG